LTAVGFASVYTARENQISSTSLVYAGFFLALFAVAHIGVRAGLPDADPWLLPLAALLCALGLTEIYRLQPTLARDQSVWLGVGLPAARHLGPLALMAAVSLGVLAVMNDLGSALLLFGIFLAMIYVATGRHLYTVLGLATFAAGSLFVYKAVPHVRERFSVW